MKKIKSAALILTAVLALTGCSESILTSSGTDTENNSSDTSSSDSIWKASDEDIVAWATGEGITGEEKDYYNITFKEFYSEYAFTIANYGLDETNDAYKSYANYYRQSIISMLSNEKIILKKAEEMGLDKLSEEDMAEIEKNYNANLEGWYRNFEAKAAEELKIEDTSNADEDTKNKLHEKAIELFREYIDGFGLDEEIFLKWQTNTYIENKVLESLYKDINVTDEEINTYIEKTIEEAKKAYEQDVSKYEGNSEYTEVWVPEGSREIKYVFLAMSSADAAEISAARNESDADREKVDAMRDEKLAALKDKAEAALEKAKAEGADFDAVIKEYSNDYTEETAGKTVQIIKNSSKLNKQLYDGVYSVDNVGDISELIPTDRGYYIIQYVEDSTVTDAEMDEIKKAKKQTIVEGLKNEISNENITKWQKEVSYEFDYEKLNIEKPEEETSSTDSSTEESKDSGEDMSSDSVAASTEE